MQHHQPILGITGGIGSGKTFVADLFGELGCLVIHADDQVRSAYDDETIRSQLRLWWGDAVFKPDGSVNRREIAAKVFSNPAQRVALENVLHPWIARQRDKLMVDAANDPNVKAFIWDTPLLYEAGIAGQCDAVVFVEAPLPLRLARVAQTRGWDEAELIKRENFQWPLDKKKKLAHYVVVNTADAAACRSQVREILSRILAN